MSTPDITHPALKQLNFIRNIHCEDAKEDRAIFIKKLESEISKIIQKKTKDLKSRLILLQGNDSETLDAVGSYIYCLYGSGDLCYRSFYGKTEEESKSILNTEEPFSSGEYKKVVVGKSLWERLCCGYTIFLGGLKCNDGLFLEGLSCKIGSVKNDLVDNNSLLIVSTLKKDVPLYFSNHFELIDLEPEKQITPQPIPVGQNTFRWCGGTWQIKFDGSTINPPDRKGLRYIHHLLANPSKEISTSELKKVIPDTQGKRLLRKRGKSVLVEDGSNEPTSDNSIDETALKQYRERLVEIDAAIKDAEDVESELELNELQNEREQILKHLKSALGKNGRPRKVLSQEENYRQSVKNCINDAFAIIKKVHPSLYNHFKTNKTIRLGSSCSYNPTETTIWNTI